ncbi:short-chain collagen C4-like isoform X2 [Oscarella lobularis]|uniref:short-chain collagen C4-like isoform X2 n=1 Tax=Oscarella lobularis TaxID=121494 RepID=UPI003313C34F
MEIGVSITTSCLCLCAVLVSAETTNDDNVQSLRDTVTALNAKVEILSSDGYTGRDGRDGVEGPPGKDGRDGFKGAKGSQGIPGSQGPPGTKGHLGLQGIKGEKGDNGRADSSLLDALSVSYTRWGRTSCRDGAELVYNGRAGGEYFSHPGGGANMLCLPEEPVYNKYYTGSQSVAYMYNAEYQTHEWNPFFPRAYPDDDVPCAVCRVKRKSTILHIPARNVCPSGWRKEYDGYLMTERHNHAHTRDFLCVDKDAESVPGTRANINGALLYFVDGRCGGYLKCGPYIHNADLSCAVCTI